MPALIFFKRKWLIASDDLVIPFGIESLIRLMWLSITTAITSLKLKNCDESIVLNYFFYALLGDLLITSMISISICFASCQGSVMEVEKRSNISKLLYLKIITVILEIVLISFGIWWTIDGESACLIKTIFIKVSTVVGLVYIFISFMAFIICYDSLGAAKYWNGKIKANSLNFFKKAEYIWRLRLKFFCCCADISEDNDFIYVEISTFLASFLNGIDLVPTDILAGIITLSHKHVMERRRHLLNIRQFSISYSGSGKCIPEWMTPDNALYFLRIAKSTYGWLAFFNTRRPWYLCTLLPYSRCCVHVHENDIMKIDNYFHTNFAAVRKITGFSESDIIYASFENNIYEPAFYVVMDHRKKYVVIAVRGTSSFSDLVTDIDADAVSFPDKPTSNYKCHRGVLRSALYIQKKINDMKLLEIAFHHSPTYTLAITGHSLGGSIASVLGLLLRPAYPDLQCYTYGSMAILSPSAIEESLDFVMTIVVGDDMSPRLCPKAGKALRNEIIESLRDTKIPKYRILMSACWYHLAKYFKTKDRKLVEEGNDYAQFKSDEDMIIDSIQSNEMTYNESSLYAPGRILYFEKDNWNEPIWLTGICFQNVIIHPDMIADHQPHKIQFMLEKYVQIESSTKL